jgi:molecular chaperone DnaK
MSVIYGIDLGTTFTKCAVLRPGNLYPDVITLDTIDGKDAPLLRSAVTVTTEGGRRVAYVGAASWTKFAAWKPADKASPRCHRFEETKLWIGEPSDTIVGDPPPWIFEPHDWGYRPEDIGALVLKRVQKEVERRRFPPLTRVVVTHPQNFTEAKREATRQAVRLAGLEVVDTITEPDAAALSFGINQTPGLYMIFDIGGGTLDIVILKVKAADEGGGSEIVTSDGKHVGGRRWDDAIYKHITDAYKAVYDGSFDPDYMPAQIRQEWLSKAERMKCELCATDKDKVWDLFRCDSEEFHAPGDTEIQLTRAEFHDCTASLVNDCMMTAELVLRNAGLSWKSLAGILMVGGSARIPELRSRLGEGGLPVKLDADPDTVVARGAALYAATRATAANELKSPGLASVFSHHGALSRGLGILAWDKRTQQKAIVNMVPKSQRLPYEKTRRFVTTQANQTTLELELWEGEDADPEQCVPIGTCVVSGLERGPAGAPINIRLELRQNGEKVIKVILPSGEREAPIRFDEARVLTEGALAQRRAFLESIDVR